jgi:hypothetical protein
MEQQQQSQTPLYKVKYYLIKAHLKVRTKEVPSATHPRIIDDLSLVEYPKSILSNDHQSDEEKMDVVQEEGEAETDEASFMMNKMITWIETNLTTSSTQTGSPLKSQLNPATSSQNQDDVQELEEEQDVLEVEMFGERDQYDPVNLINSVQPKEEDEDEQQQQQPETQMIKWTGGAEGVDATLEDELCKSKMDELLRLATSASFFF